MGRIKRKAIPLEFHRKNAASEVMGETSDCTVIAVALACGVKYEDAHEALRLSGRKERKGATTFAMLKAIMRLGFKYTFIEMQTLGEVKYNIWGEAHWSKEPTKHAKELINTYPPSHRILKSVTTHHPRRFKKQFEEWADGRDMILITSSHACAYVDGEVKDWSINKAQRIEQIIVINKGD